MSCRVCKKIVSPNATACPHCGEPNPYQHGTSDGGAAGLAFLFMVLPLLNKKPNNNNEAKFKIIILTVISVLTVPLSLSILSVSISSNSPSIILLVFIVCFLIYLSYCWYQNVSFLIYSLGKAEKKASDRSHIKIFSFKFIKFIYSKEYFYSMIKCFRCISSNKENRLKKMKEEFKLKSLEEADNLEIKLTVGVFFHIILFFAFLILLVTIF